MFYYNQRLEFELIRPPTGSMHRTKTVKTPPPPPPKEEAYMYYI
jgi:hypothetical protein